MKWWEWTWLGASILLAVVALTATIIYESNSRVVHVHISSGDN